MDVVEHSYETSAAPSVSHAVVEPKKKEANTIDDLELDYSSYVVEDEDAEMERKVESMELKGIFSGHSNNKIMIIIREVRHILKEKGSKGLLTNILSSQTIAKVAEDGISKVAQKFFHVNPDTGAVIGAAAGHVIFKTGGKGNNLGAVGKMLLERMMNGKFKRKTSRFKPSTGGTVASSGLDFEAERSKSLKSGRLFEDPEFPANDRSLFYKKRPFSRIEWKRPHEIVKGPQFINDGHSRFDVIQGALGDCWLLAAIANLTLHDELFYRVVPPDQSFTDNYAGIFHFQFWRYGRWVDVVIDDLLPTVNGRLYYMHSAETNEFWSALLEKAYAKLYGSYESLSGGSASEAFEDFTGGLAEEFALNRISFDSIMNILVSGFKMNSLFSASLTPDRCIAEAVLPNGLVRGHAYSVTGIQVVEYAKCETVLVRLRNPWGNKQEWNGPWSDTDRRWDMVSRDRRQELAFQVKADGEFWMAYADFLETFDRLEVCHLSADVMNEIMEMTEMDCRTGTGTWKEALAEGRWSNADGTAGGRQTNRETFWRNPKFGVSFTASQTNVGRDGKCTVIVALLQKYNRQDRVSGQGLRYIGFNIFQAPPTPSAPLDRNFFSTQRAVASSPNFINTREITVRLRIRPGHYIIVPATYDTYEEAEFLLRVFVDGDVQLSKLRV